MSEERRTIALLGTLDTKGAEYAYLQAQIEQRGFATLLIDCGVRGRPMVQPGITRAEVARAAGHDVRALSSSASRAQALQGMAQGLQVVLAELLAQGRFQGVVAMGGSGGTFLGTQAMAVLPTGFPKLLLSTNTYSDVGRYGDWNDFLLMPAFVDIAGSNPVIHGLLAQAAAVICSLVEAYPAEPAGEKLVATTMMGNTAPAVEQAQQLLAAAGYQALIFHANGGGRLMERFLSGGQVAGVLDLSTTEVANELCGGVRTAGPDRLEMAGKLGLPQVVAPGGLDMCNFWADTPLPAAYRQRRFYPWSDKVRLMRTNPQENRRLAVLFAEKLGKARGPVHVLIPSGGFSELDRPDGPFWWPEADRAFSQALVSRLPPESVTEVECHLNDPCFAEAAVQTLLEMLTEAK